MRKLLVALTAAVILLGAGAAQPVHAFAPGSIWSTRLPTNPPVDQNNGWIKYGMSAQGHDGSFWSAYGPNVYTVTGADPVVPVVCVQYCSNVPASFSVPASGVVGASGPDGWLAIVNPDTGRELDLWQATYDGTTLKANGGTQVDVDGSGWCGDNRAHCYSATASGSALTAGLITGDDLRSGSIDHALAFVPRLTRSNFIACPATHTDGKGWLWDPPEGARFFLPRSFVIPATWPAVAKMVAKALQEFGGVVADQGSWTFRYQQNGDWSGTDLAAGPVHYPSDFPWGQLTFMPITQC